MIPTARLKTSPSSKGIITQLRRLVPQEMAKRIVQAIMDAYAAARA